MDLLKRSHSGSELHNEHELSEWPVSTPKHFCAKFDSDNGDPMIIFPLEVVIHSILPLMNIEDLFFMRRVSKLWKDIVHCYFSYIKVIDFTTVKAIINSLAVGTVVIRLSRLSEVYFDGCRVSATANNVTILANRCRNLKVFSAEGCREMTNEVLFNMAQRCQHLEVLNVSNCFQVNNSLLTGEQIFYNTYLQKINIHKICKL